MKSTKEWNENKIKILFVIDKLTGGGAEKVLQNLVNHMDQDRFDITVLTFEDTDPEPYLNKEVHYRSLYRARTKKGGILYHSLFRILAEAGIAHALFIRDSFDIEVAYLEYGPTKFVAQSQNRNATKLAWVHFDLSLNNPDMNSIRRQKEAYRKFSRIACVSYAAKDGFMRLFGGNHHVEVIPNVIDEEEILRKAAEQVPDDSTEAYADCGMKLIAVGRLAKSKGFDNLIRCCARLKAEGILFKLEILGEGTERKALESQIRISGLKNTVFLRGFVTNPYPYLKRADVFVCSSHNEGSSTAIQEALILGKAVVTTDCPGMREIIGDSHFGILTKDNWESLYNGIRRIVTSKELYSHYEKMARECGSGMKKAIAVRKNEAFFIEAMQEKR